MEYYPIIKRSKVRPPTVFPEEGIYKVATNDLERTLADKLTERFGNKITTNQKVGYYYPDISLIDKLKEIYMDIEIDEPYSKSGIPTHFIGNKNDIQRDAYFNDNGWSVLRFSENQVKNKIGLVISTIQMFHNSLIETPTNTLDNYVNRFAENRWSYTESMEFIRVNKRDYYQYQTKKIEENSLAIISEFQTLELLFNRIVEKKFPEFNYETEMIFLPYYISDHYFDNSTSSRLLFLYCLPSDGIVQVHGKDYTINHFSNYPKIEITDLSDLESFNYITENKRRNHKIHVIKDYHDKFFYYDFFFKGTMQDYFESNLELHFQT